MDNLRTGLIRGTGAAVNVQLGWIPDYVKIVNLTDGDKVHEGFPGYSIVVFTSGGTTEIEKGMLIKGATSGATARVSDVIVDTGSWAAGDAAGWIVIDPASKVGTLTTENIFVPGGTNDATIVVDVTFTIDIDTEVAGATGNAAITPYVGAASTAALGFTIGSTISEDAKLLGYVAMRSGPGAQNRGCGNSLI